MANNEQLAAIMEAISGQVLPPVNAWQPPVTRDIDLRIARNGDWFYQGSRINRPRMVKLFSTVLRRDDEHFYLVTPQERLRIDVDDAPFTAVLMEQHGTPTAQALVFTTNVGEQVVADEQHPIHVDYEQPDGEPSPYILVRDRLLALISRPVYYQMAELAEERDGIFGVVSRDCFMPLEASRAERQVES